MSVRASSWRLGEIWGTGGENSDVAEVETLDLSALMLDLLQDLLVDVQGRDHEESDVEFDGHGEHGC